MKKLILLASLVLGNLCWAQQSAVEKIYGAVPYYHHDSKGLSVFVASGGCTEKAHFTWKVEEEVLSGMTIQAVTLIRTKYDRCEAVSHPVMIDFSIEEIGIKANAMFKIKNEIKEMYYIY